MTYRQLRKAEVEEGLRAEVLDLPQDLRRYFASVAVEVREAKCAEVPDQTVFVVARSGKRAIFYDDIEEDFGIATINGETLESYSLFGELRVALLALRDG